MNPSKCPVIYNCTQIDERFAKLEGPSGQSNLKKVKVRFKVNFYHQINSHLPECV